MSSTDGLGSLSILNEDLLRLTLRDQTLTESLPCLASISTQLLRQVLRSGMKVTLDLRDMKLAATWGEWLQQASGLHLQLDAGKLDPVNDAAANLDLLLPMPNRGISALTVDLDVSVHMEQHQFRVMRMCAWGAHGVKGLWYGTDGKQLPCTVNMVLEQSQSLR